MVGHLRLNAPGRDEVGDIVVKRGFRTNCTQKQTSDGEDMVRERAGGREGDKRRDGKKKERERQTERARGSEDIRCIHNHPPPYMQTWVVGAKIVWEIYNPEVESTTTMETSCYIAPACLSARQ